MGREIPVWVLHTNVLISAALTPGGKCDHVVRAGVEGWVKFAWSPAILSEYRRVLLRPKFGFSTEAAQNFLAAFAADGQVAPVKNRTLPDRDDEIFLATALATSDKIIVTGNAAHFPKRICAPARILTPAEALSSILRRPD